MITCMPVVMSAPALLHFPMLYYRSSLIGDDVQANETSAPAAKKPQAANSAAAAAPAGVNILLQLTMAVLLTLWTHSLV